MDFGFLGIDPTKLSENSRKLRVPACLLGLVILSACATPSSLSTRKVEIEAPYPVWVRSSKGAGAGDGESRKYAAGEKFFWAQNETLWVEAPGKASVLLTPITPETQSLTLDLPNQKDWQDKTIQNQVSQTFWMVMPKLKRIEELFSSRKYSEALPMISELKGSFPHLEYLRWVEASCLWNLGQREAALVVFKELKETSVYYTKPIDLWMTSGESQREPAATKDGEKAK